MRILLFTGKGGVGKSTVAAADDLIITVGSYRRLFTLPSGLVRHQVAGDRGDRGELQVRFAGKPDDDADDDPGEE